VKLGLYSVGTAAAADMALLLGTTALADRVLAMLWAAIQTGKLVVLDELLAQACHLSAYWRRAFSP
jgi:hypothetical protein